MWQWLPWMLSKPRLFSYLLGFCIKSGCSIFCVCQLCVTRTTILIYFQDIQSSESPPKSWMRLGESHRKINDPWIHFKTKSKLTRASLPLLVFYQSNVLTSFQLQLLFSTASLKIHARQNLLIFIKILYLWFGSIGFYSNSKFVFVMKCYNQYWMGKGSFWLDIGLPKSFSTQIFCACLIEL